MAFVDELEDIALLFCIMLSKEVIVFQVDNLIELLERTLAWELGSAIGMLEHCHI